jgi:hypothetical protein
MTCICSEKQIVKQFHSAIKKAILSSHVSSSLFLMKYSSQPIRMGTLKLMILTRQRVLEFLRNISLELEEYKLMDLTHRYFTVEAKITSSTSMI